MVPDRAICAVGGCARSGNRDCAHARSLRRFRAVAVIELRLPTADEYVDLRRSVGWRIPAAGDVERALEATKVSAIATDGATVVGLGRVVGDGAFYDFVVDLIVRPEAQGRGVGRLLLSTLEREVANGSATGVLQVVADEDVTPFYESSGYMRQDSNLLSKRFET